MVKNVASPPVVGEDIVAAVGDGSVDVSAVGGYVVDVVDVVADVVAVVDGAGFVAASVVVADGEQLGVVTCLVDEL